MYICLIVINYRSAAKWQGLLPIRGIFGNEACNVKHIVDYCEKEQVDQMLAYALACDTRDYLMLRILWRAGLRVSELLNIRPQDLEPHNQVLNVIRAKGGRQRRVMLDSETLDFISKYIFDTQTPPEKPIFGIKQRQVRNIIRKYGKMVGVDIHPHTLRHSFAIHLVRNGVDIRSVQLWLGHANLNTTQVYLKFKDDDLREIYNKVDF